MVKFLLIANIICASINVHMGTYAMATWCGLAVVVLTGRMVVEEMKNDQTTE